MAETKGESDAMDANPSTEEAVSSIAGESDNAEMPAEVAAPADDKPKLTEAANDNQEVQYVTMTPEEAAAAGVEEEEQVVTTSLQFDPANPSVLYAADGTLINQADLSPEEQALVQAALQQHLAEQEAEQQLAMIEQGAGESGEIIQQQTEGIVADNSATVASQPMETNATENTSATIVSSSHIDATVTDPVAVITPASNTEQTTITTSVNLASPNTNATQIVQSLADNVRRQQEYAKAQNLLDRVKEQSSTKSDLPEGYRYEEKIVIRQGQPQVVKMPVKTAPQQPTKRPEIPSALANLMPKIEVGKDGSQVIRIHQSQISADQLKSLQENPNVRLVFRPANSSKTRGVADGYAKKRGRPRKSYSAVPSHQLYKQTDEELSPSKTRYGRTTKLPYYQKDYLSANLENGDVEMREAPQMPSSSASLQRKLPPSGPARRGRPPGSLNKSTMDRAYRRTNTYARKIEQLREQEFQHDEELNNARLSIVPQKPTLSSVELAISTRRKNRLRELLSACTEEEIMEVALPHLARVFSLWEFLVMKVEKNKLSRVYFADIYKEYEVLHRYVSRLTDKYKEALTQEREKRAALEGSKGEAEKNTEEKTSEVEEGKDETESSILEKKSDQEETKKFTEEKNNFLKVRCKKLAQSLGLEEDELEDAIITLLDAQDVSPPSSQQCQSTASESTESKAAADLTSSNGNFETADTDSGPNTPSLLIADDTVTSVVKPSESDNSAESKPEAATEDADDEAMQIDEKAEKSDAAPPSAEEEASPSEGATAEASGGTQIIQIGTGDDKQFIEVPEGYTLIQTPEGLVMSQPGTTLSQAEDGTIYVTQEDGTTAPLDAQKGVPLETVESLLSLEGQQSQ